MAKNYLQWFNETFTLDQTSLVSGFLSKDTSKSFTAFHCPDYYISNYDICLQNDDEKEKFTKKHIEYINREKIILQDILLNKEQVEPENFYTADKIRQIKECIQEIEIQMEILDLINQNLQAIFVNCRWFPFNNKILFNIFNFAKLPLISCGDNFWLGILPDKTKYERQVKFFSVLKAYEVPEDLQLTITKLHTWIDIEYKKFTINEPLTDFDKPFHDAFRTKAGQLARKKIFDSWDKTYVAMHNREI